MKQIIKRIRFRLGALIYPSLKDKLLENKELIKEVRISSHSKDDLIPREHFEKIILTIFELSEKNVIVRMTGKKSHSIFETKIFYIPKKYLII